MGLCPSISLAFEVTYPSGLDIKEHFVRCELSISKDERVSGIISKKAPLKFIKFQNENLAIFLKTWI